MSGRVRVAWVTWDRFWGAGLTRLGGEVLRCEAYDATCPNVVLATQRPCNSAQSAATASRAGLREAAKKLRLCEVEGTPRERHRLFARTHANIAASHAGLKQKLLPTLCNVIACIAVCSIVLAACLH